MPTSPEPVDLSVLETADQGPWPWMVNTPANLTTESFTKPNFRKTPRAAARWREKKRAIVKFQ